MVVNKPDFYRGAIVRIRLINFMTYDDTELRPGPNLNMILGPNGTGKSAVVCCIIVGLAGEVSLTGRGGSPADFVKKDRDWGSTEIELFNDRGANFIVQRKITITARTQFKIENKSEWRIDQKVALKSDVQKLTQRLNIKVDNLCQFLPQDSVTQFVKMNTSELLLNTLKAAGDNQLVEDHTKLVEYTKEVVEKTSTLENLKRSCQENEINAKRLESEVHQLRQREVLVKEKSLCSQKIHYVKYMEAKGNCDKAKSERDNLKQQLREIESISEPYQKAIDFHKTIETKRRETLEVAIQDVRSTMSLIQSAQSEIDTKKIDCQQEFAKFRDKQEQEKSRDGTIRLKEQELESLECKLNDVRDVDCSKQIAKLQTDIEANREERLGISREKSRIEDLLRAETTQLDDLKREKEQIERFKDRKYNLMREKFKDSYTVFEWYSKNSSRFSQRIFSPLMCEINIKDPKFNRVVENAIPRQELNAFVCQNAEDLTRFTRAVRDELKTKFNVILVPDKTMEEFMNESSQQQDLSHLGVKGYLKDLIDAPEPILRYLCGSHNFHRIPVAESCNESQLKELLSRCPKFYVGNTFYSVSRSRYDNKAMTVTDTLREAQLLVISLDSKRLKECDGRYRALLAKHDATKGERRKTQEEEDRKKEEWSAMVEEHNDLKKKHNERKRLESMIKRNQEALETLRSEKIDIEEERVKLQKSVEKINKLILQSLVRMAERYETLVNSKEKQMLNQVLIKLAERNHKVAIKKFKDAQRDTTRLQDEIRRKQIELTTFKSAAEELLKVAEERIQDFKDGELGNVSRRKFNKIEENTVDALKAKLEDLTVRIQRIYKDSSNTVLNEFNRQNAELKDKKARIEDLTASLKTIDVARNEIKKDWLPKVNEVVDVINKHYEEFMRKLKYDGKVRLDWKPEEPDNFSAYGIQIMVRYRDNEDLIPLSSTRQSGGERSVATMIYMLALQAKTTVPFRCVDEINQGMDKENERKVFELLVKTADSSSSQYFLVSPKLLSNLPYSEKMKIHVVFNGKNLGLAWNKL